MTKTIGVGLIGTGYMGKCHALAWNAVKPVFGTEVTPRLAVLAEVDANLAKSRAAALGFAKATADWRTLIADPAVEVVSITTPNQFHAEMAIAALEAGKHVWCEKPMAITLDDAARMKAAAAKSSRVAMLGYNYIQNPAIRHIARLLDEGAIGQISHIRAEMDEDYMADPDAPFYWKSAASSGYGALDDFGVHPLSLIQTLVGDLSRVMAHQAKPFADRPARDGGRQPVENWDIASVLFETRTGVSGVMALNRAAWGRKGRIVLQIFGSRGSILYDQERMNEFQLYQASDRLGEQGYRTILTAPQHPPYDQFIPAPGHGLGFNELKIIECRQLLHLIADEPAVAVDFDAGFEIERTVHAMAQSDREARWVDLE